MVPAYVDIFEVGNDPMSGLGQDSEIPETTIYGQCDFTAPDRVRQIQKELGVEPSGIWDEATCIAYFKRAGRNPTAEDLERAYFKGQAACASAIVPVCAVEEPEKKLGFGAMALITAGVVGIFAIGYYAARRAR